MTDQLLVKDESVGVEDFSKVCVSAYAEEVEEGVDISSLSAPVAFNRAEYVAEDSELETQGKVGIEKMVAGSEPIEGVDSLHAESTPAVEDGVDGGVSDSVSSSVLSTCGWALGKLANGALWLAGKMAKPLMPIESREDESTAAHIVKRVILGLDPEGDSRETAATWYRRAFVAAGPAMCCLGAPLAVGAFWTAEALGLLNVMYHWG